MKPILTLFAILASTAATLGQDWTGTWQITAFNAEADKFDKGSLAFGPSIVSSITLQPDGSGGYTLDDGMGDPFGIEGDAQFLGYTDTYFDAQLGRTVTEALRIERISEELAYFYFTFAEGNLAPGTIDIISVSSTLGILTRGGPIDTTPGSLSPYYEANEMGVEFVSNEEPEAYSNFFDTFTVQDLGGGSYQIIAEGTDPVDLSPDDPFLRGSATGTFDGRPFAREVAVGQLPSGDLVYLYAELYWNPGLPAFDFGIAGIGTATPATPPSNPLGPIVQTNGPWRQSAWLEWHQAPASIPGWFIHATHGWVYLQTSGDDIYFWYPQLNWLYTRADLYPYLYEFTGNRWIFYQHPSSSPLRWFFDETAFQAEGGSRDPHWFSLAW